MDLDEVALGEAPRKGATATGRDTSSTIESLDAHLRPSCSDVYACDTTVGAAGSRGAPRWQWYHRTGYKNYSSAESERIEQHYRMGAWMMRMKCGSGKNAKPREIYFVDMLQHDPTSQCERSIRRVPELSRLGHVFRRISGMCRACAASEPRWWKPKDKAFYEDRRLMQEFTPEELAEQRYRMQSVFYRVSSHWMFSAVSVLLILVNSLYIWIDADFNKGVTYLNTEWPFVIADNIFTIYFTAEVLFRALAYKRLGLAFLDPWLVFDSSLALLMILETWALQIGVLVTAGAGGTSELSRFTILRILRLLRLLRVTRLFRVFPQLFVLVKGIVLAMRSLLYTLLLLFLLVFVFGVAMKNFSDLDPRLETLQFDSVGRAMWSLWVHCTLLDNVGALLNALSEVHIGYAMFVIVFIFVSNLTMLNMLVGVLCEVITRVSAEQKNETDIYELDHAIRDLLECYDVEDDKRLRLSEFRQLMTNPDLQVILKQHNIDRNDLLRMEGVMFEPIIAESGEPETRQLTFDAFVDKVFQLRGGNAATVNDVVELRNFLTRQLKLAARPDAASCAAGETTRALTRASTLQAPGPMPTSSCGEVLSPTRPSPAPPPSVAVAAPSGDAPETRLPLAARRLPGQIDTSPTASSTSTEFHAGLMPAQEFQRHVLSAFSRLQACNDVLRSDMHDLTARVERLSAAVELRASS